MNCEIHRLDDQQIAAHIIADSRSFLLVAVSRTGRPPKLYLDAQTLGDLRAIMALVDVSLEAACREEIAILEMDALKR